MTYSRAQTITSVREHLSKALEDLQHNNLPPEINPIASHIAQAISALFEAARSSSEPDGLSCTRAALENLSQTLALLQDLRDEHQEVARAVGVIAKTIATLYPLTIETEEGNHLAQNERRLLESPLTTSGRSSIKTQLYTGAVPTGVTSQTPRKEPHISNAVDESNKTTPSTHTTDSIAQGPATDSSQILTTSTAHATDTHDKILSKAEKIGSTDAIKNTPVSVINDDQRIAIEANIGATTESNFFVGFSGEVADGGVFLATYDCLSQGTPVQMLVTLPGGFEFRSKGVVSFVRGFGGLQFHSQPGMGIRFENLETNARALVLRFVAKRAPLFYDA